MAMFTVIVAGIFETCFALLLKKSHGLTRLWPSIGFAICALVSFALLTLALKKLEVGTAYAIWTGIGAGGTAILGITWLGESASPLKIIAISLILGGVICLNFAGVSDP
jgi:quaternary ammonium compound-resistance protein SugE